MFKLRVGLGLPITASVPPSPLHQEKELKHCQLWKIWPLVALILHTLLKLEDAFYQRHLNRKKKFVQYFFHLNTRIKIRHKLDEFPGENKLCFCAKLNGKKIPGQRNSHSSQ